MSRFSQLYIERGLRASDSARARRRLNAVLIRTANEATLHGMMLRIAEEQGCNIPVDYSGAKIYYFTQFFNEADIRDVLDGITGIFSVFSKMYEPHIPKQWISAVERIFQEEHLAYRVDPQGIAHPFVDAEFEVNRASALEVLGDSRFGEARTDFEAAHRHLRDRNGKEALWMMFVAAEVAAKVLFPGKFAGLAANEVEKHIRPVLDRRYAGNQPAIVAGRLLLGGMKSWINASHLYRHGGEQQEPAEPPLDFVIAHLSAGATHLRWMIELCSE